MENFVHFIIKKHVEDDIEASVSYETRELPTNPDVRQEIQDVLAEAASRICQILSSDHS